MYIYVISYCVFVGYSVEGKSDFLKYSVVSKEGVVVRTLPITIKNPIMMHDFAITSKYSVFLDFPFVFDPSVG